MRVLIVEDEEVLAEAVRVWLTLDGFAADIAPDGESALASIETNDYDVVLLDRDLPGMSGDAVCTVLADRPDRPAVLMVTAANHTLDKVDGLGLGADDYLGKPFEMIELSARVQALTRRQFTAHPPILEVHGLTLDPQRRRAARNGSKLALSPKEFAVLEVLMRANGTAVSAEQLLEKAWDENADPFTSAVKVTMSTLRAKLGQPPAIRTIPRSGYALNVSN